MSKSKSKAKEERFHIIQYCPGSYYVSPMSPAMKPGSVGHPLLATRVDPKCARLNLIDALYRAAFPNMKIVEVVVKYEILD